MMSNARVGFQSGMERIHAIFKTPTQGNLRSQRMTRKILALAQQPLLLLMLAIYHSDNNQLHKERRLIRHPLR